MARLLRSVRALPVVLLALWVVGAAGARAGTIDVQVVTSPGGISAWLVEDHSMPLIAASVGFHGGSSVDPAARQGLARFVSALLDEGAGDLDSRAFQQRLNDLAIDFRFSAGIDDFTGSMRTLTDRRAEAFDLLRLALSAPRFDTEPVERIRGQLLAVLTDEATDPGSIADRVWWHATFPDHPYGWQTTGTEAGIRAITADDLRGYVRRTLARDNLVVGVVGDITAAELAPLLDATFGGLPAKADMSPVPEAKRAAPGAVIIIIDKDVPQSVVLFGQDGIKRNDPDFFAAYLMNHILGGGGFSSRLTREVREKRGLAYSVSTAIVALDRVGLIQGSVGTQNARVAESIAVIREEWRRMRDEGPTEAELADAKLYITGSYPLRFSSTSRIADILVGTRLEGFDTDYFNKRNGYVEAVTLEDVRRVARRLLDAAALTFVIVGQPEGIAATQPPPEGLF
ncbi:MAG: M16 family metallopeptidase [Dongiaceae bacterium]